MLVDYIYLSNARLLLALNHALAEHPHLYALGLICTDKGADIVILTMMLMLWFWPEPKGGEPMFAAYHPQRGTPHTLVTDLPSTRRYWQPRLTRQESRAQLIVFGLAGMAAYVTARLLAMAFDIDRPFATFLPVEEGVRGAFTDLRRFGSFPSDHAALLGALPVALYFWSRPLALVWLALSVFLMIDRVAVGFHYPGDMLAGAILGAVFVGLALYLVQQRGRLYDTANAIASGFNLSNEPYCYFLYFAVGLVGIEFAFHFKHVLAFLFEVRGALEYRLQH